MNPIYLRVGFAAILAATLSCDFVTSLLPGTPGEAASVLLNEVLFLPTEGQFQFVEIKAVKSTSLEGLSLLNENQQSYALPSGVQLNAGEVVLILFDGQNKVEGDTIHADRTDFLNSKSGFVELKTSEGTLLDRVAWGIDQLGGVKLSRGGVIDELIPGTAIGRFPSSIAASERFEWVIFSPAQVTPGVTNPNPGVEILLPSDGAIFDQPDLNLAWYIIAGAVEYRVQLAAEEMFAAPLIDQTITAPPLAASLEPGEYFWRVQAIAADGSLTDFSPVSSLKVSAPGTHLSAPARQGELDVPFFWQHKDTGMLLLESQQESGAHAWDMDHEILDMTDPADRGNCVLAVISMINAYFHNSRYVMLSQDRIGFEVYKNRWIGPELDLNYDEGFDLEQTAQALKFAMGEDATFRNEPKLEDFWADVKTEIDATRPIFLSIPSHAVVVRGYIEEGGDRFVLINNPYIGQYRQKIESLTIRRYWLMPANPLPALDESTIVADTDGDGVVDFDESELRFGTDSNNDDSDKDDVKDKQDIAAGVFDPEHGYAFHPNEAVGRDFDADGWAMELDEDSDDGGCFDGLEDFDLDGKYKEPETYNFDEKDDACFWGTDETYYDIESYNDEIRTTTHLIWRLFARYSLRPLADGTLTGSAQITFEYSGENHDEDTCPVSPVTTDPPVIRWSADLAGTYGRLLDGTVNVTFTATPDHSPPYSWVEDGCLGRIVVPLDGAPWIEGGGQLKDGVYDLHFDAPLLPSETGEYWTTIHMEQAGNP